MELPRLEEIWKKYSDRGVSIVAVLCNQDRKRGRSLIREKGLTFHYLEDEENKNVFSGVYLCEGSPTTFLIDGAGRVVSYHTGFAKGDEAGLEKEIVEFLED